MRFWHFYGYSYTRKKPAATRARKIRTGLKNKQHTFSALSLNYLIKFFCHFPDYFRILHVSEHLSCNNSCNSDIRLLTLQQVEGKWWCTSCYDQFSLNLQIMGIFFSDGGFTFDCWVLLLVVLFFKTKLNSLQFGICKKKGIPSVFLPLHTMCAHWSSLIHSHSEVKEMCTSPLHQLAEHNYLIFLDSRF